VRCPRAALRPAPGRLLGIRLLALQTRPRGARWTGTGEGGSRPHKLRRCCPRDGDRYGIGANPRPRNHGLRPHSGDDESQGKNRGGTPTGERARSGGSAQAGTPWRAPHPLVRTVPTCVCRRSASFPFFLHPAPRKRGRVRTASAGWWKGRRIRRSSFDDGEATSQTPFHRTSCGPPSPLRGAGRMRCLKTESENTPRPGKRSRGARSCGFAGLQKPAIDAPG
jgi:hypothetical protein